MALVEEHRASSPLLHVVDGRGAEGRIRRAERLRRDHGGHAIVLGGLDEECFCAGIGLHSIGSAPWRSIAMTVARACRGFDAAGGPMPVPTAWSNELGIELTRTCSRVILVADGPPPRATGGFSIDRAISDFGLPVRPGCLEVITPDGGLARAWARFGVADTRIVEPCGLPAAAHITTDRTSKTYIMLVPQEHVGQQAINLYRKVGLAHLGGAEVQALLDPRDPGFATTNEYVVKVGIDDTFASLRRADPRPQIALVSCDSDVRNDERILDLTARGIGVFAFVPSSLVERSSPLPGIVLTPREDVNSGASELLEICLDPDRRTEFQMAARAFSATRAPRTWSSVMGVATCGRSTVGG